MRKRCWTANETFRASLEIFHFGRAQYLNPRLAWYITDAGGAELASGVLEEPGLRQGNGIPFGDLAFPLSEVEAPIKLFLIAGLEGTPYYNDWEFWVYPGDLDCAPPDGILVTRALDEEAEAALAAGGRVLLALPSRAGEREYSRHVPAHLLEQGVVPEAEGAHPRDPLRSRNAGWPRGLSHGLSLQLAVVGSHEPFQAHGAGRLPPRAPSRGPGH